MVSIYSVLLEKRVVVVYTESNETKTIIGTLKDHQDGKLSIQDDYSDFPSIIYEKDIIKVKPHKSQKNIRGNPDEY